MTGKYARKGLPGQGLIDQSCVRWSLLYDCPPASLGAGPASMGLGVWKGAHPAIKRHFSSLDLNVLYKGAPAEVIGNCWTKQPIYLGLVETQTLCCFNQACVVNMIQPLLGWMQPLISLCAYIHYNLFPYREGNKLYKSKASLLLHLRPPSIHCSHSFLCRHILLSAICFPMDKLFTIRSALTLNFSLHSIWTEHFRDEGCRLINANIELLPTE